MQGSLVFVGGIYGSGKSTLSRTLGGQLEVPVFTASELIGHRGVGAGAAAKAVVSVTGNQAVLVSAILEKFSSGLRTILLDGHFCVPNQRVQIEEVSTEVFRAICTRACVLIDADINVACQRLKQRDGFEYPMDFLAELALREERQAVKVASDLGVPFLRHDPDQELGALAAQLRVTLERAQKGRS